MRAAALAMFAPRRWVSRTRVRPIAPPEQRCPASANTSAAQYQPLRRLQHHLRVLTPRGDVPSQLDRVMVNPNRRPQPVTSWCHPHHHAPPPVQIHTHLLPAVILVHNGHPSS